MVLDHHILVTPIAGKSYLLRGRAPAARAINLDGRGRHVTYAGRVSPVVQQPPCFESAASPLRLPLQSDGDHHVSSCSGLSVSGFGDLERKWNEREREGRGKKGGKKRDGKRQELSVFMVCGHQTRLAIYVYMSQTNETLSLSIYLSTSLFVLPLVCSGQ